MTNHRGHTMGLLTTSASRRGLRWAFCLASLSLAGCGSGETHGSGTAGQSGNAGSAQGGSAGSAGSGGANQGGAAQGGSAGNAGHGGSNQGGSNQGGSSQGGAAQGGSAGDAGSGGTGGGCGAPRTSCADGCFDLQSDFDHCGACETHCTGGYEVCSGSCLAPFDEGYFISNIDNGLVADDTRAAWLLGRGNDWLLHSALHSESTWRELGTVTTPAFNGLVKATLNLTPSEVLVLVDDQPNARVLSFPVTGGNPTEVASSQHEFGVDNGGLGVARSGDYLVWLVGRGIHRLKAGESEELWYQSYALSDLIVDGDRVWWKFGTAGNYDIYTLPLDTPSPAQRPLPFVTDVVGSFTVAGDDVFYPRGDGIYRKPVLGGSEQLVVAQTDVYFGHITADDVNLYWTWLFKTSGNPLPLYSAPLSALGSPRIAASHKSQVEHIAAGGGMLYWADSELHRAPRL